jgi:hypothetical protein
VKYAFADTRSSKRFLIAKPDDKTTPQQAAQKVLEKFLPRAFRRQVSPNEISEYMFLV